MSERLPLVLDLTTGGPQQLQSTDKLDEEATGLTAQERFDVLEANFQLLIQTLTARGIDLPLELTNKL